MHYLNWLNDDIVQQFSTPDMQNRTVTMMFTDIVESTSIKQLLPGETDSDKDKVWVERFQQPHHAIVRECLSQRSGREVKTIGDAFFVTFDDAAAAVSCAIEIQRKLIAANLLTPLPGGPPLQVRIGVHTGTPIQQGVDYVGTAVDKASRVESAAVGGQLLLSSETFALVERQLTTLTFERHGGFLLKGLGEKPHELIEMLWDGKKPTKPKASKPPSEVRDAPTPIIPVPDDFPLREFATDVQLLRTAANRHPMHVEEWKQAVEQVTHEWLQRLGQRLFLCVFNDDDLHRYYWETQGELRLQIPDALHEVPFELLHDGNDFVVLTRGVVRVSRVEKTERRKPQQSSGELQVLAALCGPVWDERHDPNDETQPHVLDIEMQCDVFRHLADGDFAASFQLVPHATRGNIDDALAEEKPAIFHFVGHGNQGRLLLEGRHAQCDLADMPWLQQVLREDDRLQMVVLGSCLTASGGVDVSVAGAALRVGVPLVVAMQHSITVTAATHFFRAFYRRLVRGGNVVEAMRRGRREVKNADDVLAWEWATPVLIWDGEGDSPVLNHQLTSGNVTVTEPERPTVDPHLQRSAFFVGRRKELVAILRALDPQVDGREQVVMLHAGGGFGKTSLAREVVHRATGWFPGGITFAQARTRTPGDPIDKLSELGYVKPISGPKEFLVELGRKLELELTGEEPEDQLPTILANALNDGQRRLLVLDNLDEIYADQNLCHFLGMLPRNTRALVTSRSALHVAHALPVAVGPLSARDAAEMTLEFAPSARFTPTANQMNELLNFTGGNALAIKLALNAVGSGRITFDGFLVDLKAAGGSTEELFNFLFDFAVREAGESGVRVFKAMSLFATHARRDALAAVCDIGDEFGQAVEHAVALSLVDNIAAGLGFTMQEISRYRALQMFADDDEFTSNVERFTKWFARLGRESEVLEPLVAQQFARTQLGAEAGSPAVNGLANQMTLTALRVLDYDRMNIFRALMLACEAKDLIRALAMYNAVLRLSDFRSYWAENLACINRIWLLAQEVVVPEKKHSKDLFAQLLCNLGNAYKRLGAWNEADSALHQSLLIQRELKDRRGEGELLVNIGALFEAQERMPEAQSCLEEAFSIFEELKDRVGQSKALNNLGGLLRTLGRHAEAGERLERSLLLHLEEGDRYGAGDCYGNIGSLRAELQEWSKADAAYQQSHAIWREYGDRVKEGETLRHRALLSLMQDDIPAGLQLALQAREVLKLTQAQTLLARVEALIGMLNNGVNPFHANASQP